MAALLQQELEASELAKLPKTIQSKLEKIVSDLRYEIDSLKAQHEQFRVDSGKLFPVILIASCAKVFGFAYSACMHARFKPCNVKPQKFERTEHTNRPLFITSFVRQGL